MTTMAIVMVGCGVRLGIELGLGEAAGSVDASVLIPGITGGSAVQTGWPLLDGTLVIARDVGTPAVLAVLPITAVSIRQITRQKQQGSSNISRSAGS